MIGPRPASDYACFAIGAQNMYLATYQRSCLCNALICLLRKQLDLPHLDDMPARPRGVYPPKWLEGAFSV